MREQIVCSACKLNSRVRGAFALALDTMKDAARPTIYLTEQASIPFVWAQRNFKGKVVGSEFEKSWWRRRSLTKYMKSIGGKGRVRFQDVTRLSFGDARIDLLLSLDVLEHVPDYERAIGEFARVLKPEGHLVATFPFLDVPDTLTRAKWVDGQIVHC